MRLYDLLLGYVDTVVPPDGQAAFFELCRTEGLAPKSTKRDRESGNIVCRFHPFAAHRLALAAKRKELSFSRRAQGGLPFALLGLLRRPVLVLGVVLAIALLVAGHLVVWDIEITGNERLAEGEVEAALLEAGLARGAFLPRLDGDTIALRVRQSDKRFAYVSVNFHGTVAAVQIVEAAPEPQPLAHAPANLVARRDGVVTLPLIFEGECLVAAGEAVRAGQILASGVIDTESGGVRITRAAGQVLARTEEVFVVKIPFEYMEKSYTGRVFHEFELLFFSLGGKVFKTTGNLPTTCDIIKDEQKYFAGAHALPIGSVHTAFREYTWVTSRRTAATALELAASTLSAQLADACTTRTLLSKTVETAVGADGVTLICTAVFEEDIAAVSEFSLTKGA